MEDLEANYSPNYPLIWRKRDRAMIGSEHGEDQGYRFRDAGKSFITDLWRSDAVHGLVRDIMKLTQRQKSAES